MNQSDVQNMFTFNSRWARSYIHERMEQRKKIVCDWGGGEGYRKLEGEALVTQFIVISFLYNLICELVSE